LEHEAVDACAVVVNKSDPLHPQLTAYVTLKKESGLSSEEIKEFLLKKLPEYMIPAQYMFIDKMTFTPSGKINRKALPEPSFSTQIPLVEPSNNIEKLLLGIWKSVLKTDNIGINSNFFDLGGNSILAINLASLISKKFNITLKTLTIFEFPSIKDQSKFLAGKENDRFSTKDNEIYARMERKKNVRFKKYRK